MNTEFAPILASEMKKFNLVEDQNRLMPTEEGDDEEGAGPSSSVSDNSKVQRVRNEVDRVKDIVIASLDSVMERGERKCRRFLYFLNSQQILFPHNKQ